AGGNDSAPRIDSIIVSGDQRRVQTVLLTGVNGTLIAFMLPEPVLLRMGDALELDDGSLVDVVVEPEPLIEVRGNDLTHLARLAWHLGDRHVPVQILANRLRLRRDAALEAMLAALGARLTAIDAAAEVTLAMPFSEKLTHQHGFIHAGIVTMLCDTACGFAALSLMPEDAAVLTTEFKVNLLSPAKGERFVAHGRVVRPGKKLMVCLGEVFAEEG